MLELVPRKKGLTGVGFQRYLSSSRLRSFALTIHTLYRYLDFMAVEYTTIDKNTEQTKREPFYLS